MVVAIMREIHYNTYTECKIYMYVLLAGQLISIMEHGGNNR
jgi:hypothetical protein